MDIRKIIIAVIIGLAAAFLSGCSVLLEEEETKESLESFNVDIALDELPSGLYLRQDGKYTSPYSKYRTYSDFNPEDYERDKNSRIIWYTDQADTVPTLSDEGLVIFKSDSSIPEYFTLESFEHLCDSVGIRGLTLSSAGKYSLSKSKGALHALSSAYTVLEPYLDKGTILLDTINGTEISSSMINKAGSITGLEEGKKYRLGFYIGTRYYEEDLIADTHIYSTKTYYLLSSYEMTKNGYLIVRLPELLTPGLYDLNASGTFWYGGITTATHEDDTEYLKEESENTYSPTQEVIEETLPIEEYADSPDGLSQAEDSSAENESMPLDSSIR